MEAQLEYIHIAYMFLHVWHPDLFAQSALINKISASWLSRKFIEGPLLVGHSLLVSAKIWYANEDALVFAISLFFIGGLERMQLLGNFLQVY